MEKTVKVSDSNQTDALDQALGSNLISRFSMAFGSYLK